MPWSIGTSSGRFRFYNAVTIAENGLHFANEAHRSRPSFVNLPRGWRGGRLVEEPEELYVPLSPAPAYLRSVWNRPFTLAAGLLAIRDRPTHLGTTNAWKRPRIADPRERRGSRMSIERWRETSKRCKAPSGRPTQLPTARCDSRAIKTSDHQLRAITNGTERFPVADTKRR